MAQVFSMLNGKMATNVATFTGTATSTTVAAGGLTKIHGIATLAVGTATADDVGMFQIGHELVAGQDWFAVPSSGKVTINRVAETGGTLATCNCLVTLIGF
jgi:hypothetical protein